MATAQTSPDTSSGLKTAVNIDILGAFGKDTEDRVDVREAEITLYGPIDHLFDGVLSAAAHQEGEESVFEVHEAYVSTSRLIPRTTIKAGKFFLGVGRLGRLHRHAWPFVQTPSVHQGIFGEEGVADSGGEFSFTAPLPFVLDVTLGVTAGRSFGHQHDHEEAAGEPGHATEETATEEGHAEEEGHSEEEHAGSDHGAEAGKPRQPTHYARISSYTGFSGSSGIQYALNYLARKDAAGTAMTLTGADFTLKWKQGGTLLFLWQSEAWLRTLKPEAGERERGFGWYAYPQYGLSPAWQLGLLYDSYSQLDLHDAEGADLRHRLHALTPTLTYKASEFSLFRVACKIEEERTTGKDTVLRRALMAQISFNIGAHPTHDF